MEIQDFSEDQSLLETIPDQQLPNACKKKGLYRQTLGILAADMIHFSYGFASGYTSPTIDKIQSEFKLSNEAVSWFASILVLGQILGCLFGGPLGNRLGRRWSLIIFSLLSAIGWIIIALSTSPRVLLIGRFLQGMSDALAVTPSLLFAAEISHVSYRGVFINSTSVMANVGIPVAYIIAGLLSWRTSALVAIVPPIVVFAIVYFIPESPVFLINKNRSEEAVISLKWFRGCDSVSQVETPKLIVDEMKMIIISTSDHETNSCGRPLSVLTSPRARKPFLVVTVLMLLIPLTGGSTITFYCDDILKRLRVSSHSHLLAILASSIRCIGSIGSGYCIFGLKPRSILIISSVMVLCASFLASLTIVTRICIHGMDQLFSFLILVSILAYMFFWGLGVGPIPMAFFDEWFCPDVKSSANSLSTTSYFISVLISLQMSTLIDEWIGVAGLFFAFAAVTSIYLLVVIRFVPK